MIFTAQTGRHTEYTVDSISYYWFVSLLSAVVLKSPWLRTLTDRNKCREMRTGPWASCGDDGLVPLGLYLKKSVNEI